LGCARGRRRWLPGGASSGTLGSPPPAAAPSHSPAASSLAPPPAAALAGANAGGDGRGRQRRGVTRAVAARLALLAPFPRRWRWAGRNGSKGTPGAGSAAAGHGPLFSLCRSHSGGIGGTARQQRGVSQRWESRTAVWSAGGGSTRGQAGGLPAAAAIMRCGTRAGSRRQLRLPVASGRRRQPARQQAQAARQGGGCCVRGL
jgi:hypothetical protein